MHIVMCCKNCEYYVPIGFCSRCGESKGLWDSCVEFQLEIGDATYTTTDVEVGDERTRYCQTIFEG